MTHPSNSSHRLARRAFLKRAAALSGTGVAAPLALNLAAIGEAAAFNATDYKALVCVCLNGGNDYANTLVPFDNANYDLYSKIRGGAPGRQAGGIAHGQQELLATALTPAADSAPLPPGLRYALHPAMTGMANLFAAGRMAVQLNVGTLVAPTTKAQYLSRDRVLYPLPPQLFSHNDQASIWQSSSPEGSTIGWGGNIGDLALSSNGNATFTCIQVGGNSVFLAGDEAAGYTVSNNGALKINALQGPVYGLPSVGSSLRSLINQASSHALENAYVRVAQRAVVAEAAVASALTSGSMTTAFPNTDLGAQLKMVARLIAGRSALGVKRQVYMVNIGGFDVHSDLMARHAKLLTTVSEAITAFYNATVALGVANQVTTFTTSEFGRTFASNGAGSDHGWGGHHFVVGGAVRGQRFVGTAPAVEVDGPGDVGQGRLIPTTAVDQYAATLATWFGVSQTELPWILPNIGRFGSAGYPINLGFLA